MKKVENISNNFGNTFFRNAQKLLETVNEKNVVLFFINFLCHPCQYHVKLPIQFLLFFHVLT